MKFVIAWTPRAVDAESQKAVLAVYDAWAPPQSVTEMLNRVDGKGGGLIVETDSAEELAEIIAPFGQYLDFDVYPVIDPASAVAALRTALDN